jgi:hypothetical protein
MYISWGENVVGAYSLQPYHPQVLNVLKSGRPNLLEPSGPVIDLLQGLLYLFHSSLTIVAFCVYCFYTTSHTQLGINALILSSFLKCRFVLINRAVPVKRKAKGKTLP